MQQDPQAAQNPDDTRSSIYNAIAYYNQALKLQGLTNVQNSAIHKNLIRAYIELERHENSRQIKLYFFDQSLENLDKALFLGVNHQPNDWIRELISRASTFTARLRIIFSGESSESKADFYEKIFVKMNKANVDFVH